MDTKAFKRSPNIPRITIVRIWSGSRSRQSVEVRVSEHLVQQIRDNNYTLQRAQVTIRLAEAFFCWCERAVAMAYETRQHFPLSGSYQ